MGFFKSDINLYEIIEKYKTPLFLYDEEIIVNNIRKFKENFKSQIFETEIIYASKAFQIKEILRVIKREGLSLDCVSFGELYTASKVLFPFEKIYLHGNNKSFSELEFAVLNGCKIIVDNLDEMIILNNITNKLKKKVNILLRINVGVSAHTHEYIVTSHIDSKFGIAFDSKDYIRCISIIMESNYLNFIGFHFHIGSQIFDLTAFYAAIDKMFLILSNFNNELIVNIGGGFGIRYTDDDHPIDFALLSKALISYVEKKVCERCIRIKCLCIEPGRSIIGEAGYTIYKIGGIKKTINRLYYFVDGGMSDNIRPALYKAKYEADILNRFNCPKDCIVTIAGKCCESGDILLENILLPKASIGDYLIVYSTGAYCYSMSSNYNKNILPAIVFINKRGYRLVCRRQTYDELIEREI